MEWVYLAAIALAKPLDIMSEQFAKVALPSEILERLSAGMARGQRFLIRWVKRWLVRRWKKRQLIEEGESVAAFWANGDSDHQTPSDPGLRKAIEKALTKLKAKDRECIVWLSQGLTPENIAQLRKVTSARMIVLRAREAFNAALPKDFRKKKK